MVSAFPGESNTTMPPSKYGSEYPADPTTTTPVLTVALAEEY